MQFIIGRNPGEGPDPSQDEIEASIRDIVRTFDDDLAEALNAAYPPERVAEVLRDYAGAFGSDYRATLHRRGCARATSRSPSGWRRTTSRSRFFRRPAMPETRAVMSFHHLGDPIPLSRRVPLLENLGFSVVNERTYCVAREAGPAALPPRHDAGAGRRRGRSTSARRERLHDAVLAVWHDKAENDGFNALVLSAGLAWRRAALLRTIARYLRQTAIPYSIDYLWGALRRYPAIAALLVELFAARFEPGVEAARARREPHRARRSRRRSRAVASLDDDTILRAFRAGHRGDAAHRFLRRRPMARSRPRSR